MHANSGTQDIIDIITVDYRELFDCATGNPGYPYSDDLQALDGCEGPAVPIPVLSEVSTPFNIEAWTAMLSWHPDQQFTKYIVA